MDNKESMISYAKLNRHHTCVHHGDVAGGLNPVDRFASTEIPSPKLPCGEFPHDFLHVNSLVSCCPSSPK